MTGFTGRWTARSTEGDTVSPGHRRTKKTRTPGYIRDQLSPRTVNMDQACDDLGE